jgi:hypothetical protein
MNAFPSLPARFSLFCAGLLCALPFLQPYHLNPLTSFHSEWFAGVLGIGVMAVLLGRQAWIDAEVPWIALLPFALAALLLVHGVLGWSPYFGQALSAALYLVWAGGLIVAARALVRECGREAVYTAIAVGLAAGALLNALAGIIQHFNWVTPLNAFIARPTSSAIFGNLAQPNHYASQLALGLFSLAYLLRGRRWFWLIAAASPLLFVLGLSGSRSVWLYLVAAFVLAAWLRRAAPHDRAGRLLFFSSGAFILICWAMQALVGIGLLRSANRSAVTAVERLFSGEASVSDRFNLWQAAWSVFLEHPLAGSGWGTFSARYFDFMTRQDIVGPIDLFQNAHNILLHFMAEAGLIGALLLVAPLLFWLRHLARGAGDVHRWWLFATAAVLALHSLLEYPLWYAYFLGVAALLLGIAPAPVLRPQLARVGRPLALAALVMAAFNLTTLRQDYREFEAVFRIAPKAPDKGNLAQTMARLHRNPVLTAHIELASALPLAVDETDLQQRIFLVGRVLRFAPLATLVYRQVLLLALAGRQPEAQALLLRARRAYPAAPPEFGVDLERLAAAHPERFRPLLESAPRHVPAHP